MDAASLLNEIIEAHGARGLWDEGTALDAVISARGFLFTVKRRRPLDHVRVTAEVRRPRFRFHDFPHPGLTAELIGNDEVRVVGAGEEIVERRLRPRAEFRRLRRLVQWDTLDFVYFGGYATWNYLLGPLLFLHDGLRFEALGPPPGGPSSWVRLGVTFPDDLPTHCRAQTFTYDESRHLRRLDYTAEVIGRWARAAHLCSGYRDFSGYLAPTTRRVLPLPWGHQPLAGPVLVALDVHDLRPVRAAAPTEPSQPPAGNR